MARNRRTANAPESAERTGPTLRDVLAMVKCPVTLRIEDPYEAHAVDATVMHGRNGIGLTEQLERSRVLAGQALLACRPIALNVTAVDNNARLVLTVRPFRDPPERKE